MEAKQVVFSFDMMMVSLRAAIGRFPDLRTGKNIRYEMMDAAAGSFSVFFTQCESFLEHQERMQQRYGFSNAKTLFGMRAIPSDNQIRNLLDGVPPALLSPVFDDCFSALDKSGHMDSYRVQLGTNGRDLLLALDGVEYFSSETIHCDNCSKKTKAGKTMYSHSMVTPTIVGPGKDKVISLVPEFIVPQDGDPPSHEATGGRSRKQDCEIKASKRWIDTNGEKYSRFEVTLLGDDLYAHDPWCKKVLKEKFSFIFVCKPESHKTVYEWIEGITKTYTEDRFDGKKHLIYTYKYAEGVPLTAAKDALLVNFVEVKVTERATGKEVYHNAFITNHALTEESLPAIVDAGRARWKIENENNNTLKTKGYHLEHNFGHGEKYLANILATMNILAFLFHTMLEFMNEKYQLLRRVIKARKTFFNHIKILLIYHCFANFENMMEFMVEGLKKPHDINKLRYPI